MGKLTFTDDEKSQLVSKLKRYFEQELDTELGGFDAEFLIDFIAREMGAYFYNRGLYDAQTLFSQKFEEFADSVYELEQPTGPGAKT